MPGCTDEICKECFKAHFTLTIKEKTVKHFNCPLCGKPDLANRDMSQGVYLELFVNMVSVRICIHCCAVVVIHNSKLITIARIGRKYWPLSNGSRSSLDLSFPLSVQPTCSSILRGVSFRPPCNWVLNCLNQILSHLTSLQSTAS